jgi:hypothetical protein
MGEHASLSKVNTSLESQGKQSESGHSMLPPAFQLVASSLPPTPPVQAKSQSGGLPENLVDGFASNTGQDLSNVNVHYNSAKPKEVGALAYAQGNDIHIGAGQEKHLPHEAAHIVQQREGRVKPTTEVAGMPVNDNPGLEMEADRMGEAAQLKANPGHEAQLSDGKNSGVIIQQKSSTIQRVLDEDDFDALAEQVHAAIDGWGTDEEGVYVALQKLNRDPAAIQSLKDKYEEKYDTTLENDLRGDFSRDELRFALELIGIQEDPCNSMIDAAAPSTAEEFAIAITRLKTAMEGGGTDEEAIFATLLPFNRNAADLSRLKSDYQVDAGRELADDLTSEMSDSELAYALYLLNAPPPETSLSAPGITLNGAEQASESVNGGNVSVRTGDELTGTAHNDLFSLGFDGALADESRWLQFIWREIIVTGADGAEYRLNDTINTTGGSYNLTDDPADPHYNTDSADASSPFYEAAGLAGRTAEATTIYDMPGAPDAFVRRELLAGATGAVARAHFHSFLIRDFRPIFGVDITVEWTYVDANTPPRVQSVENASTPSSLPSGMKARLVEQYPNFAYIE